MLLIVLPQRRTPLVFVLYVFDPTVPDVKRQIILLQRDMFEQRGKHPGGRNDEGIFRIFILKFGAIIEVRSEFRVLGYELHHFKVVLVESYVGFSPYTPLNLCNLAPDDKKADESDENSATG
jgi:hypothetical protein